MVHGWLSLKTVDCILNYFILTVKAFIPKDNPDLITLLYKSVNGSDTNVLTVQGLKPNTKNRNMFVIALNIAKN